MGLLESSYQLNFWRFLIIYLLKFQPILRYQSKLKSITPQLTTNNLINFQRSVLPIQAILRYKCRRHDVQLNHSGLR